MFFDVQKCLVWLSPIDLFFLCYLCFWCHIQEIIIKSKVIKHFPMFLSKSSIVLAVTFRSSIHCELIFIYSICYWEWGSGSLPLKSQYRGKASGKESLLYFGCWQPEWRGGQVYVQRLTPPPTIREQELLWMEGGGYMQKEHCPLWQSSWN